MPTKPQDESGHGRRGVVAAGRKAGAGRKRKIGRGRRVRSRRTAALEGMDLFGHLCEVMGLFPEAGHEAVGEIAGRLMTERRKAELGGKRHREARTTCRRTKAQGRK